MDIYNHNNYFLDNEYTTEYYSIINLAISQARKRLKRNNPLYIYYESHHILPKSIFPEYANYSMNKWNQVLLTAKEHFRVHQLLPNMVTHIEHKRRMLNAFYAMSFDRDKQKHLTEEEFALCRAAKAEAQSLLTGPSHHLWGKKQSKDHIKKRANSISKHVGEDKNGSILTNKEVIEIWEALKSPYWGQDTVLAKAYNVNPYAIYAIKKKINWKWLTDTL